MNELKIFNYEKSEVRTVILDNEPWWVAKDVCEILEHTNSRMAISSLDEDEKGVSKVYTLGGEQEMTVINEAGLYSLIIRSNKPEAKQFKRWITHEVIPSIRKHGMYATEQTIEKLLHDPDTMIKTLQALKSERALRTEAENLIEIQKPKVIFADAVAVSNTSILIGDLAKILKQNNYDIGANRLFEKLRKDGYLIKRRGTDWNMPTQYSMDLGLFEIKETIVAHSDGHTSINKTTKVSGKGQLYFINKFLTKN